MRKSSDSWVGTSSGNGTGSVLCTLNHRQHLSVAEPDPRSHATPRSVRLVYFTALFFATARIRRAGVEVPSHSAPIGFVFVSRPAPPGQPFPSRAEVVFFGVLADGPLRFNEIIFGRPWCGRGSFDETPVLRTASGSDRLNADRLRSGQHASPMRPSFASLITHAGL